MTTRDMIQLVARLLRPYRAWVALVLLATLLETGMSLAAPWPLKIILDNVLGEQKLPHFLRHLAKVLPGHHVARIAALAAVASVLVAAIGALASYVNNYYTENIGQWVANDLRLRLYDHLEHLSLTYHHRHRSSALLSTLIEDIDTIQDFASSKALNILVDLLAVTGMLCLMLYLNWDFALIATAVAPVMLLVVARLRKEVKKATREVRNRQSDILGVVQEGLEEIRMVHALGLEKLEQKRLADASRKQIQAALKARKVKSLSSPITAVIVALCVGLVLWRGTLLVLASAMTVGSLTVFLSYLKDFFKPVRDLAKMSGTMAQTAVGMERVRAILDVDMRVPERPDARDPGKLRGAIEFDHVAFAYEPEAPVLRDVSFSIEPGQFVGIVGGSGSGKSTAISLIPRFYDPMSGTIRIDGVDVRHYKLQALREQIAYVLQETPVLHGTVRDNIACGRPNASFDEVTECARLSQAHEFISRMPNGYNTLVGERGVTLSGGQRARIGIARALLRNAPILILDEAASALDSESEKLIGEALEPLLRGRATTICIAHRLGTIRSAHKILVLKDGVVAEQGTHAELMALDGQYAELYRIQAGAAPTDHSPLAA